MEVICVKLLNYTMFNYNGKLVMVVLVRVQNFKCVWIFLVD
jgi:hypothetical protein